MQKTKWAPELVIPVARAKVSAAEVLSQNKPSSLEYIEDQVIALTYEAEVYSVTGAELLALIDRQLEILAGNRYYQLVLSHLGLIESLGLSEGLIEIIIDGPGRSSVSSVEISIPSIIIDGQPYKQSFNSIEEAENEGVNLNGATLILSNAEFPYNSLETEIQILDEFGTDVTINYSMFFKFKGLVLKWARGWFDQLALEFDSDTIELDIFKVWKSGSVLIENPRAEITMSNSIGIPLNAKLETFDAHTTADEGLIIPIDYENAIGSTFEIGYPDIDDIMGIANSAYELNRNNSNLRNVIKLSPDRISYKFNLIASHNAQTDAIGEITDTSRLVVRTKVQLPFQCQIERVKLRDTISVSVGSTKEFNSIESAQLNIKTINGLPIDLDLQLYLLNADFMIIDSVFTSPRFLTSAITSADGKVIDEVESINSIITSASQLQAIGDAKHIAIKAQVSSVDGGSKTIVFQSSNSLGIELSLKAKYRVQ